MQITLPARRELILDRKSLSSSTGLCSLRSFSLARDLFVSCRTTDSVKIIMHNVYLYNECRRLTGEYCARGQGVRGLV